MIFDAIDHGAHGTGIGHQIVASPRTPISTLGHHIWQAVLGILRLSMPAVTKIRKRLQAMARQSPRYDDCCIDSSWLTAKQ